MKKSLIAGAGVAALAMAAVPFAGVFAADITSVTDTLTVTIEDSCTFDAASHSYSEEMTANQLKADFGETVPTVTCNNAKGYTVSSQMNTLTGPAKAGSGNEEITYSTTDLAAAGAGKYSAGFSNVIGSAAAVTGQVPQAGTLMTSNTMTPAGGDKSTINYKVSTTTNQAGGTYTGTAVYTLSATE